MSHGSFMNWLLNWIVSCEPTHRAGSACFVLLGPERSVEELRSYTCSSGPEGELELWLVFPDVSVFKESTKKQLVKEEFHQNSSDCHGYAMS